MITTVALLALVLGSSAAAVCISPNHTIQICCSKSSSNCISTLNNLAQIKRDVLLIESYVCSVGRRHPGSSFGHSAAHIDPAGRRRTPGTAGTVRDPDTSRSDRRKLMERYTLIGMPSAWITPQDFMTKHSGLLLIETSNKFIQIEFSSQPMSGAQVYLQLIRLHFAEVVFSAFISHIFTVIWIPPIRMSSPRLFKSQMWPHRVHPDGWVKSKKRSDMICWNTVNPSSSLDKRSQPRCRILLRIPVHSWKCALTGELIL